MQKSLLRGFRHSLKRLSDASSQVAVTVDNISKTIILGSGKWHLPFEWVLDNDTGALDANSQRACVVSPNLVRSIEVVDATSEVRDGQVEVSVEWNQAMKDTDVANGSIPCSTPTRSTFRFREPSAPPQTVHEQNLHSYSGNQSRNQLQTSRQLWSGSELYGAHENRQAPPARVVVKDFFSNPSAKSDVVRTVEKYGFAVAEDAELAVVAGSSTPAVVQRRCDVAEKMIKAVFPVLRNSHYGAMSTWSDGDGWKSVPIDAKQHPSEGTSSFRDSLAHLDGAYLSSHLDLHTDGTYFLESPKLQSYGCIFTTPQTVGGETTISDGFAAVSKLPKGMVDLLSKVKVGGQYRKEGLWYEAHRPVVAMDPSTGHVTQISFNNADRMPMSCAYSSELLRSFYDAYHTFHKVVHDDSITFQLKPGQMLFFDNHRALHGRKQFSGPRVMCGAYIGLDEYYSSLLMAEHSEVK